MTLAPDIKLCFYILIRCISQKQNKVQGMIKTLYMLQGNFILNIKKSYDWQLFTKWVTSMANISS